MFTAPPEQQPLRPRQPVKLRRQPALEVEAATRAIAITRCDVHAVSAALKDAGHIDLVAFAARAGVAWLVLRALGHEVAHEPRAAQGLGLHVELGGADGGDFHNFGHS